MSIKGIRLGLARHLRTSLVSGLILLVPIALTYVIVSFLFDVVDGVLRPWIQWILAQFGIEWTLPGPGILAAAILVYLLGAFAAVRIGRRSVDWARASLLKVPFIGTIYSANRQLVESFSGTSTTGFKRVVLVQFPKAGTWSLGFLTGITDADDAEKLIMTYVPTAPLPNSGFVVLVPPKDVLDTDLSVPDAMQLIFSGGIVSPRTIKTRKIEMTEVERQIRKADAPSKAITSAVGSSVSAAVSKASRFSIKRLRRSSAEALAAVESSEHGSVSLARDAMIGAVQAVEEHGTPSVDQVRQATIGVTLGVGDATGMTNRTLHDAVAGAIHGGRARDIQNVTLQGAAEGTMRVAASAGIPADQAVTQVSRATVETLKDSDNELVDGSKASMLGVIAGAAAANEDVLDAARHSAYELVSHAAAVGFEDLAALSTSLVEAASVAGESAAVDSGDLEIAVAAGCLRAAELVGEATANAVNSALFPTPPDNA